MHSRQPSWTTDWRRRRTLPLLTVTLLLAALTALSACSPGGQATTGNRPPVTDGGASPAPTGQGAGRSGGKEGAGATALADLVPGRIEFELEVGPLTAQGPPARAVVVAAADGRALALAVPVGKGWRLVGREPLDLPPAPAPVRLRRETLSATGAVVLAEATLARGEPQMVAFSLGPDGLKPVDYYALTAPAPEGKGVEVVVDKYRNVLYHFADGQLVRWYRVATGHQITGPAPTWTDYNTNLFTPEGRFIITDKTVNPVYYGSASHPAAAGGSPDNPLGPRWLGFSVLSGDQAKIWGIHGTNEPESIGRWVSDGCVRMKSEQVTELFERLPMGTPLRVLSGRPVAAAG